MAATLHSPAMKPLRTLLVLAALTLTAVAQPPPGAKPATPGAPGAAPAKAKPYSASDTHIYLTIADGIQFQLGMSQRLRGKYKDGPAEMLAFAAKTNKESTELWTPGVDAAMAHGVEGKKIPQDMSKNDKAALAKFGTNKDEKKWELAIFEFYTKEAKKNAGEAEKGAKAAQDADLKAFAEKTAALLKSQEDSIEAKFKEIKAKK